MRCEICQRDARACRCQARLLPETPAWREEMRQRVEHYRARERARRGANAEARAMDRVLAFRKPEPPIADPVICPPLISRSSALAEVARVLPEPQAAEWLPRPAVVVPADDDAALAEPVARGPVRREMNAASAARVRAVPSASAAYLQLPLPMSATAAESAATMEGEPLPVAPLDRRLRAGLFDLGVVAAATVVFTAAAWASVGFAMPDAATLRHLLPAMVGVPGMLAALYVLGCAYAGGVSVGMRRERLQVRSFEGELSADAARWRAWASLVSLAALGMGFAWARCDAQRLTWHDYMSRTFVADA
ncbi:MAG TPA: RDD family protein [Terriglobales bacterium]|nr:RDD family protein [Terriglobales bacterium]